MQGSTSGNQARQLSRVRGRFPATLIDQRIITLPGRFRLESGESMRDVRVAMRLVGAPGAPVVAALGGISAGRCPVSLAHEPVEGWWQAVLTHDGFDLLAKYQLLSFDFLGGNGETTAPSNWGFAPETFPAIDTRDHARLLARLLDALAITRIDGFIGASYGGMVALHFAHDFPHRLKRALVIGATHRPDPLSAARRRIQRRLLDLATTPNDRFEALSLARALAMTTYRTQREFSARFDGADGLQTLESYLRHTGERFASQFEFHAYCRLLDSIDTHCVDPSGIATPLTLLSFDSDQLCPPDLLSELVREAGGPVYWTEHPSRYGHDAFLLEVPTVAAGIREFLQGASA